LIGRRCRSRENSETGWVSSETITEWIGKNQSIAAYFNRIHELFCQTKHFLGRIPRGSCHSTPEAFFSEFDFRLAILRPMPSHRTGLG
jgi:hypothetical protein